MVFITAKKHKFLAVIYCRTAQMAECETHCLIRCRRHCEASEGHSIAPRWRRRTAILKRSAGGVLLLSLQIWSIHLQRGRPGGHFHSQLGGRPSVRSMWCRSALCAGTSSSSLVIWSDWCLHSWQIDTSSWYRLLSITKDSSGHFLPAHRVDLVRWDWCHRYVSIPHRNYSLESNPLPLEAGGGCVGL